MFCQRCNINFASVKVTHIIGGERFDLLLCPECVAEIGLDDPFSDASGEISRELFNLVRRQLETQEEIPDLTCAECGLKLKNFTDNGLLGCPQCYVNFEEYLKILLRRYHGSNKHQKSTLRNKSTHPHYEKILRLEQKLRLALKREDFESAALLRDEIKDLKAIK